MEGVVRTPQDSPSGLESWSGFTTGGEPKPRVPPGATAHLAVPVA